MNVWVSYKPEQTCQASAILQLTIKYIPSWYWKKLRQANLAADSMFPASLQIYALWANNTRRMPAQLFSGKRTTASDPTWVALSFVNKSMSSVLSAGADSLDVRNLIPKRSTAEHIYIQMRCRSHHNDQFIQISVIMRQFLPYYMQLEHFHYQLNAMQPKTNKMNICGSIQVDYKEMPILKHSPSVAAYLIPRQISRGANNPKPN